MWKEAWGSVIGTLKKLRGRRGEREDDIVWVMDHCLELRGSGKFKNSSPVFFPGIPEDKPLYDELVKRGFFVVEPLEDGYMIVEDYKSKYTIEDEDGNLKTIGREDIATSAGGRDGPTN